MPFNKATAELSITVETKVAWLEGQLNEHYLHNDPDTSCRSLLANVVLAHLVGSDTGMATLVETRRNSRIDSDGPQHVYKTYLTQPQATTNIN